MGRKIAPTLREFVEGNLYQPGTGADSVRRELRALLAVARAAKAYKLRRGIDIGANGQDVQEGKRLIRALARLERAGKEEG